MRWWCACAVLSVALSGRAWCIDAWDARLLDSGDVVHLGGLALVERSRGSTAAPRQVNLSLILDASGSMNAQLAGSGRTRLAIAKEVLHTLLPRIPSEIRGSLWIYGHRLPKDPQPESCGDIEEAIGLANIDAESFIATIDDVRATGHTPIAESIRRAAATLPAGPDQSNVLLLVSDGEETCGGDPCSLAAALKASEARVVTHVVGYAVDEATQEQLQCIARASGGTYAGADDPDALLAALQQAVETTISETILRVEMVSPEDEQVHGDLWLCAAGAAPGGLVSGYTAWTDNSVPPGRFDLVVRTLPWIFYPGLALREGGTTSIRIPLCELTVLEPAGGPTRFELHDADVNRRLGAFDGTLGLAPGTYRIAANNSTGDPIELGPGERRTVTLGTIRVLSPTGEAVRATVLDQAGAYLGTYGGDITLVPGAYRIGVNRSSSGMLRIEDGGSHEVRLGGMRCIAPDGTAVGVTVFDAAWSRLGHYRGDILLVAGTYSLEIHGSVLERRAIEEGRMAEVALGAVELSDRYEMYANDGKRLGSFDGVTTVFPGTYSIRWGDQVRDGVVIGAGEIVRPE